MQDTAEKEKGRKRKCLEIGIFRTFKTKSSSLIMYYRLFPIALLLWIAACQPKEEGCMDPLAENYNVIADQNCCCEYYQLNLNIQHFYGNDSTTLNPGQLYADAQQDSFSLVTARLFLSDIRLRSDAGDYKSVEGELSLRSENVADDYLLTQTSTFRYDVGKFTHFGRYDSLQLRLGLGNELLGMRPADFEEGHPLNNNSLYQLEAFRSGKIEVQLQNEDSTRTFFLPLNESRLRLAIEAQTVDGQDTQLPLGIDYAELFDGIAFAQDDSSTVVQNLLSNWRRALFIRND